MNGHLHLLKSFGVDVEKQVSDFTHTEINDFFNNIKTILPFEPYDFQEIAFKESLLNVSQICKMCTGSGKSLTIALIAEFFRQKGKKGLLLVPNINLLTQFKNDIKDYNLQELYDNVHVIGGGQTVKHFDKTLTISTWQSLQDRTDLKLDEIDYLICDEAHRFASEETSGIVKDTINCRYKFGFTGTLPEDPTMKMQLFGLFGLPKTYIRSSELIERGLATPISIQSIFLNYSKQDVALFKSVSNDKSNSHKKSNSYLKQLKFIKEHSLRNKVIVNLAEKLRKKGGNTLILFQHTEHGKELFYDIMKMLYNDVNVENKDITGKKSFAFQEQYGVYFLNGEDNSETREKTRKILENHTDAILIANFSLLSTGVNIKKLHQMILASPLKAYTTVTQSIGRLMRLHDSKTIAYVFDLVDNLPPFKKQYKHRLCTSYNLEEFPITEKEVNLF